MIHVTGTSRISYCLIYSFLFTGGTILSVSGRSSPPVNSKDITNFRSGTDKNNMLIPALGVQGAGNTCPNISTGIKYLIYRCGAGVHV